MKILQGEDIPELRSGHLENQPFGDLLETESRRILTAATLLEPCIQTIECSAESSDDSNWNGMERFIQPFEISYELDNMAPPADPSPEKEKPALKVVSQTRKRTSPLRRHSQREGEMEKNGRKMEKNGRKTQKAIREAQKNIREIRYSLNEFIDRNGQLQTHTASQLVSRTRSTLPL